MLGVFFTLEFNFFAWCVFFLFSMIYLNAFKFGQKSAVLFALLLVVNLLIFSTYAPINYQLFEELPIFSNSEIFFVKVVSIMLFFFYMTFLALSQYDLDTFENERLFLYITIFAAAMFMVGCSDPLLIFIFIEITSLATFGLIALAQTRQAYEAAIKYVIFSSISSCFFIVAFLLSENLNPGLFSGEIIKLNFSAFFETPLDNLTANFIGQGFLALTFLIKFGLGPYSAWVVDAYEAAKYRDFLFISTVGKLPVLFAFLNIFSFMLLEQAKYAFMFLIFLFGVGASISLVKQQKIRRFFAYSSIFNFALGFTLMLSAGDSQLLVFSYFAYYILLGIITYTAFDLYRAGQADSKEPEFIYQLAKYNNKPAFNLFAISIILNSGLPPLGIFLIKATAFGTILSGLSFSNYDFLVIVSFSFLVLSMANMFAYFKLFGKVLSFEKFKFTHNGSYTTIGLFSNKELTPATFFETKKSAYNLTAFFFILLTIFFAIYYLWVYIF